MEVVGAGKTTVEDRQRYMKGQYDDVKEQKEKRYD